MDAFKSARLFLPHKVVQIQPDAFALDCLKAFPFLNSDNIMKGLKAELPAYLAHAVGVSSGRRKENICLSGVMLYVRYYSYNHHLLLQNESSLYSITVLDPLKTFHCKIILRLP